jgi:hypothetical protein
VKNSRTAAAGGRRVEEFSDTLKISEDFHKECVQGPSSRLKFVWKLRRDKAFKLIEEKHWKFVRGVCKPGVAQLHRRKTSSTEEHLVILKESPKGRNRRSGSCGEDL